MSRDRTLGPVWSKVSARYGTPATGTLLIGALATVVAALALVIPRLADMIMATVNAVGIVVALSYALTALAAAARFRGLLREDWRQGIRAVVLPSLSATALLALGGYLAWSFTPTDHFEVSADNGWFLLLTPALMIASGFLAAAWAKWSRKSPYFRTGHGTDADAPQLLATFNSKERCTCTPISSSPAARSSPSRTTRSRGPQGPRRPRRDSRRRHRRPDHRRRKLRGPRPGRPEAEVVDLATAAPAGLPRTPTSAGPGGAQEPVGPEPGGEEQAEVPLAAVRAYADAHPEQEMITGGGWSMKVFAGGTPTKELLDAVVRTGECTCRTGITTAPGSTAVPSSSRASPGTRPTRPTGALSGTPGTGEPNRNPGRGHALRGRHTPGPPPRTGSPRCCVPSGSCTRSASPPGRTRWSARSWGWRTRRTPI